MQAFVLRIYRKHPTDSDSVSGMLENIETGQEQPFQSLSQLQSMLARSIETGTPGFPDLVHSQSGIPGNIPVID
jgi:hypothetical protein